MKLPETDRVATARGHPEHEHVGAGADRGSRSRHALREVWEAVHRPGSVLCLAPSATAAYELAAALGIGYENTAKWLYESTGPAPSSERSYSTFRRPAERTPARAAQPPDASTRPPTATSRHDQ